MRKIFISAVCIVFISLTASADYLVWKTGAVMKIVGDYNDLNMANSAVAVTLLDGNGKRASIYITKDRIDWDKTKKYNTDGVPENTYKENMVSVTDLKSESLSEQPQSSQYISNDAVSYSEGVSVIEEDASVVFGQVFIDGKIRNNMSVMASGIVMNIDYYDAYDRLLTSRKQPLDPSELSPGKVCDFKIMAPRPSMGVKISRYEIDITWDK